MKCRSIDSIINMISVNIIYSRVSKTDIYIKHIVYSIDSIQSYVSIESI